MYVQGGLWLSMREAEKEVEGDPKPVDLSDDHRVVTSPENASQM